MTQATAAGTSTTHDLFVRASPTVCVECHGEDPARGGCRGCCGQGTILPGWYFTDDGGDEHGPFASREEAAKVRRWWAAAAAGTQASRSPC